MKSLALALSVLLAQSAASPGMPPTERGVALGLFSMEPNYRYLELLEELKAHGATHVSLTWVWWQDDLWDTKIGPLPAWTATDAQIAQAIADARTLGLHVTAFPILRLRHVKPGEWRGRISPADEDAWWQSYRAFILHAARLARTHGAARLCVGSELLSRERMRDRWLELIERVRLEAPQLELLYSANWDHFEPVSFWDAVDVVGVTGYFELTKSPEASYDSLRAAWAAPKQQLLEWSRRLRRPFVLTEVGYPSIDGGAAWPWNDARSAPIDLEEQHRAYRALIDTWADTPELAGVYWWNWFGFGGPQDPSYSPRNKPAAEVLRSWFERALTIPKRAASERSRRASQR